MWTDRSAALEVCHCEVSLRRCLIPQCANIRAITELPGKSYLEKNKKLFFLAAPRRGAARRPSTRRVVAPRFGEALAGNLSRRVVAEILAEIRVAVWWPKFCSNFRIFLAETSLTGTPLS